MRTLDTVLSNQIHTVIGAGQIGPRLARVLADAGAQVRLVRRGPPGAPIPGVQWMQGDITDPAFADTACAGAVSVYNCTNPPEYHRWDGVIQPLYAAIQAAATRAGARLVVLDNLYMLGATGGRPMTEQTPMQPCSEKGRIRKEMTEALLAARDRGELQVAIGRAPDFFGPGAAGAVYGDRLGEALAQGKALECFGDIDLPRSYAYVEDVALGLAVLGTRPEAVGRIWHLPVSAQGTTRELLEAHARAWGAVLKPRVLPRWAVRAMGFFVPPIGAMVEMLYQWEEPFIVDDSAFRQTFGIEPTPLEQAVAETVQAWRQRAAAA